VDRVDRVVGAEECREREEGCIGAKAIGGIERIETRPREDGMTMNISHPHLLTNISSLDKGKRDDELTSAKRR